MYNTPIRVSIYTGNITFKRWKVRTCADVQFYTYIIISLVYTQKKWLGSWDSAPILWMPLLHQNVCKYVNFSIYPLTLFCAFSGCKQNTSCSETRRVRACKTFVNDTRIIIFQGMYTWLKKTEERSSALTLKTSL